MRVELLTTCLGLVVPLAVHEGPAQARFILVTHRERAANEAVVLLVLRRRLDMISLAIIISFGALLSETAMSVTR